MDEFDDPFYQKYNVRQNPHSVSVGICPRTRKLCFPTKTQCRKHRKEFEDKHKRNFGMYQCDYCGTWHFFTVEDKFQKNKKGKNARN